LFVAFYIDNIDLIFLALPSSFHQGQLRKISGTTFEKQVANSSLGPHEPEARILRWAFTEVSN